MKDNEKSSKFDASPVTVADYGEALQLVMGIGLTSLVRPCMHQVLALEEMQCEGQQPTWQAHSSLVYLMPNAYDM